MFIQPLLLQFLCIDICAYPTYHPNRLYQILSLSVFLKKFIYLSLSTQVIDA